MSAFSFFFVTLHMAERGENTVCVGDHVLLRTDHDSLIKPAVIGPG